MRKEHGKSEVRQRDHCTSGHRSVQRFHFRGRQSMGSLEDCCRGKRLRSSYVASHECCAEGGASHRRYRPGDYESWQYIAPIQKAAWSHKIFENGTWGGEIAVNSLLSRVISWPSSIGVPAALPTPIWICSSKSMASTSSSSSGS